MSDDLIDRLRLVRSPGIGPITFRQLIARFGSAAAALAAVPDLARRGGGRSPNLFSRGDAEREAARVERLGARYLMLGEELYPRLLAEMDDAPPLLIAKGQVALLERTAVAIVGARNASAAACRFARGLAHGLGQQDAVVVSGLARGIDSAAHDGALDSGTIGVVAGGGHRHLLPAGEPGSAKRHKRARAGGCGNAARHRAPGAPFPLSQPDHRRPQPGHRGRRGGAALGLTDHRAPCDRGGARGDGGPRLAARPAGAGLQPADPRRRGPGPVGGGRDGGDPAVRGPRRIRRGALRGGTADRR